MSEQRMVMEASLAALRHREAAALAVVVATEGSTYVRAGAMALFGAGDTQVGWLSGGCLEPEIAVKARAAAATGQVAWMDVDTRDDEDLFSGSALGCRGRLHLALLPLRGLAGWDEVVRDWLQGAALQLTIEAAGVVAAAIGGRCLRWRLPVSATASTLPPLPCLLPIAAPPRVLLFGAGPESAGLLPLLRRLGWMTTVVERRERWRAQAQLADRVIEGDAETAVADPDAAPYAAALVMQHNFELDRAALAALAGGAVPFIGLLGPVRRREDLFRVLPASARAALAPRLHSPVGLDLGGHGPEAIALSIAAQLQAWRGGGAP
ncbi:XdhC family protein [Luteimonas suaedae]|uniref:XdhC family protein n=1 Tax=Luteimonas suaedae TaxID=2605430 RepID=UPI0011EEB1BD|nr:XdhC/CoxI family protein [Luteimonas suaedae]